MSSIDLLSAKTPEEFFNMLAILESNEADEELEIDLLLNNLGPLPKLERQNNLAPGQRYMTDEEIEEELSKSAVDFSLLQIPKLQRQPSSRQTFSAEQCVCDFKEFEFTPNKVLEEADDFESIFKNISLEYCKKCVSFICDCKLYN